MNDHLTAQWRDAIGKSLWHETCLFLSECVVQESQRRNLWMAVGTNAPVIPGAKPKGTSVFVNEFNQRESDEIQKSEQPLRS
jgi:hypothetical protein